MIGPNVWRKGLALVLAAAVAALFYAFSQVNESAQVIDGRLVFSDQAVPASGGTLLPAAGGTLLPAAGGTLLPAAGGMLVPQAGETPVPAAGETIEPAAGGMLESVGVPGLNGGAPQVAASASWDGVASFDRLRSARLQERARRIEILEEMLAGAELTDEERRELRAELLSLVALSEKEGQAEGLLAARGLYDAVVVVGPQNAEVIVSALLTRDQAAQVGSLVSRVAEIPLERITIVDGAPAD